MAAELGHVNALVRGRLTAQMTAVAMHVHAHVKERPMANRMVVVIHAHVRARGRPMVLMMAVVIHAPPALVRGRLVVNQMVVEGHAVCLTLLLTQLLCVRHMMEVTCIVEAPIHV